MTSLVTLRRDGPVGVITMNRPDKLNAVNEAMFGELDERFAEAEADDAIRVVILEGAGKAFCVGFDVVDGGIYGRPHSIVDDQAQNLAVLERWLRIWDFPKPVIAKVHGYCLAMATQLALVCDLTFVADDAVIGAPSLPLGGGFISPLWVHAVGPKKAKEFSYVVGLQISGAEAAAWGWANRAVPADELDATVTNLAHRIGMIPAGTLRLKKRAINRAMELTGFREAVLSGADVNAILHFSPETQEIWALIQEQGLKATIEEFQRGDGEP